MTRVAMIANGIVRNVVAAPDFASADEYGRWVLSLNVPTFEFRALDDETEAQVSTGWTLVDGVFVEPPTPLAVQLSAIDEQTSARIAGGFLFKGQRMSLSDRSQITILGAYTARSTLPYPFPWANADDSGFVTIESAKDVEQLYAASVTAVLLARTAGNARKKAAMEAAS